MTPCVPFNLRLKLGPCQHYQRVERASDLWVQYFVRNRGCLNRESCTFEQNTKLQGKISATIKQEILSTELYPSGQVK